MTKRLLRTVPAAILMTTAMAWNLPALAQTPSGAGAAPSSQSSTPPRRPVGERTPAPGNTATGMGTVSGLPADLTPAMPASDASAAQKSAKPGSGFGPTTGQAAPKKP